MESSAHGIRLVSTVDLSEKRLLTEVADQSRRSNSRSVAIVNEQTNAGSRSRSEGDEWLINIIMDAAEKGASKSQFRPRIQKASNRLRDIKVFDKCFDPALVSIGPYHHGNPQFQFMEDLKIVAARRFVSDCSGSIFVVYNKVAEVAAQARDCYSDGSTSEFNDVAFTRMMFLDGCFILRFIYCIVNNKESELTNCCYTAAFLMRDLFLLENQLPYMILQELINVRFTGDEGKTTVDKFINQRISPPGRCSMSISKDDKDQHPLHLLDLLCTRMLGKPIIPCPMLQSSDNDWHSFPSVKELKTVGINFKRSHTNSLRDIHFKSYKIYGELSLPPIAIDDSTKPRFLNLIAYELSPDGFHDYAVTSYICFLDALIDHADDVKELRSKGILLNFLGSDEQVADLFNELTTELVPDPNVYYKVKSGIEKHYKNQFKVSIVEFLTTHFGSPWTAFAFFAAILVVILTCIQTVFTVYNPK